jgi:retron-type reverse transcriptase
MAETQTSVDVFTKLERIAKLAREAPDMAFRNLAHHIDINWLREAYRRTRKDGARGVDGQSADSYAANLEGNLQSLLDRAKSGTYLAPPVRRVHIPKGSGGETRPLGIPTFEDKVLQRAVVMVLEAVYEQGLSGLLVRLSARTVRPSGVGGVAEPVGGDGGRVARGDRHPEVFRSPRARTVREVLRHRVHDGVLLRLIDKWLHAGVLEDGSISYPDAGTPQGGVISPMLANIFLHDVLDAWFVREVKPRLAGKAAVFRYADDAVFLFANESDARRVLEVLPKRLGKYGLELHPDKTRLVDFRRPDRLPPRGGGDGSRTFDLLGFTHFWGKARSGKWVVKRRTAKDRFDGPWRVSRSGAGSTGTMRCARSRRHLCRSFEGTSVTTASSVTMKHSRASCTRSKRRGASGLTAARNAPPCPGNACTT